MLYFKVRKEERLTFIVMQEEKRNKTREHEKAIPVVDQISLTSKMLLN